MHTYKAYHTLYCSSHELCCLQPALCSKAETTSTDISCAQSIPVAQMMSVTRTFVIFLYLGHCQSYLQMVLAENTSLSLVSLEKPHHKERDHTDTWLGWRNHSWSDKDKSLQCLPERMLLNCFHYTNSPGQPCAEWLYHTVWSCHMPCISLLKQVIRLAAELAPRGLLFNMFLALYSICSFPLIHKYLYMHMCVYIPRIKLVPVFFW